MTWWWWGAALSALPWLRHAHILTLSFSLHVLSVSTYYRSDRSGSSGFSGHFGFSGHPGFPVISAFRSFQLSSCSPSNRYGHCKQKKLQKEKRTSNYPPRVAYC
jgi:hypothetical protein